MDLIMIIMSARRDSEGLRKGSVLFQALKTHFPSRGRCAYLCKDLAP